MLLRLIVLVLTVANLVYFGWTEGWLDGVVGARSTGDREPARADAQVRPELMALSDGRGTITAGVTAGIAPASAASSASAPASTGAVAAAASAASAPRHAASQGAASGPLSSAVATVGTPAASSVAPSPASAALPPATSSANAATGTLSAAKAAASSPAAPHTAASAAPAPFTASANSAAGSTGPAVCLESGPYPIKEAAAAESAFKTLLPAGGWSRVAVDKPGVWMIYMGRFTDNEARRKKEGELSRRNATFEEIEAPAEFAKGLSLGRFPSRAEAEKGLAELNKQGVHTARIVVFQAPVQSALLRVEKADPATADRLKALRTSLPVVACQP